MTTEEETANIIAAMELIAEKVGDVSPAIFKRYFERCNDSKTLMEHMDKHMLGRMMDQVLLLLMESGEEELGSYIDFETSSHRSYGVKPHMYESLMLAVQDVFSQSLGSDFTSDMIEAFRSRIDHLLGEISASEV